MHLYAKDLDDLRALVASRGEVTRKSTFVCTLRRVWGQRHQDRTAQNIGTVKLFPIVSKNNKCSRDSSWKKLLPATSTFHFEDDGATNIFICNYNGKHEPQQIDCILSSDNRVRSRTSSVFSQKVGSLGTDCRHQII